MVMQGPAVELVAEWIVRFLANPIPLQSEFGSGVLVRDGQLMVESRMIYDKWNQYIQSDPVLKTAMIGKSLGKIGLKRRTAKHNYYGIDMAYVQQMNEDMGLVVDEQIDEALNLIVDKTPKLKQ
jgi:hypothetical protein